MPASEIRKEARKVLAGKWGKAVCIVLVYVLYTIVIGLLEDIFKEGTIMNSLVNIGVFIISIPVSFGLMICFMKLKRNEEVSAFGFFQDGFSRFSKSWGIFFRMFIRLILPIVCVVLVAILLLVLKSFNMKAMASGSISSVNYAVLNMLFVILYLASIIYAFSRSLLYSLCYYIGYDNPELSSKDCVLKSESLMKGNRGNIFLLGLSFIGWVILACCTFGIGFLWLIPYIQVANICFYEKLSGKEITEEPVVNE